VAGAATPQLVQAVRHSLNAFDVDNIVDDIRVALREEHATLLAEVDYLTAAIDDEHTNHQEADLATSALPSVEELRSLGDTLRETVEREQSRVARERMLANLPPARTLAPLAARPSTPKTPDRSQAPVAARPTTPNTPERSPNRGPLPPVAPRVGSASVSRERRIVQRQATS
jgi:hypothetical protein